MLIYNNNTAHSKFPFSSEKAVNRDKSTAKLKRTRSISTKVVKRGGQLRNKPERKYKSVKRRKRVIKNLSVKNRNFLKKLGFRVKKR